MRVMKVAVVKNRERLLKEGGEDWEGRSLLLDLVELAIRVSDPRSVIKRTVMLDERHIIVAGEHIPIRNIENIYVVGAGKASGAMAEALEEVLGEFVTDGAVCVQKGTSSMFSVKRIRLFEADHPIPGEENIRGAEEVARLAEAAEENDLLICLISGGGSAMLTLPVEGLELQDIQEITAALLKSGVDISKVNTVRRHLSRLKGGLLAKLAYPARVVSLIVSDIVGDRLEDVASGPTAPDPTTFSDAINILKRYRLWERCGSRVKARLTAGVEGKVEETPKPNDPVFRRVQNFLVATNREACTAVANEAARRGLNSFILTTHMEGEAREVGYLVAGVARSIALNQEPLKRPALIVMGGETTVTMSEDAGRGGRNQELALSAALKIAGLKGVFVVSFGTDGVDGVSYAAGALVDGNTVKKGDVHGVRAEDYLQRHDTTSFFEKIGDGLIVTGPTGTNVNDVLILAAL
ncbi:MAG: glycerate kinase [Candidatus Freyarchaeota archaeon]|nr:glycerate kinase [Candidatus Jordarchaeia archaeon]